MGRRTRGGLAAATACLAAACGLVAPLDGLSGSPPPQTDDATSAHADTGAPDSPGDATADSFADSAGNRDSTADGAAFDATADRASSDTGSADADAGTHDADAGSHDADAASDAPSSVYRAAVLADTPLAYWRLDETSGTVAHDATGHGYDGTYTGTYTLGTTGALAGDPDTAVTLDGVTGQVDIGDNFDFAGQVPFSFEAWVKPAVIDSTYRHVVTKMLFDTFGNPEVGTYVLLQQGSTILGFERWVDSGVVLAVETSVFPGVGVWTHVVTTYDGSAGTIYVNGSPVQTAAAVGGVPGNGVHLVWGNLVKGVLDEAAVYGAALPASRVSAHYQAAQ